MFDYFMKTLKNRTTIYTHIFKFRCYEGFHSWEELAFFRRIIVRLVHVSNTTPAIFVGELFWCFRFYRCSFLTILHYIGGTTNETRVKIFGVDREVQGREDNVFRGGDSQVNEGSVGGNMRKIDLFELLQLT